MHILSYIVSMLCMKLKINYLNANVIKYIISFVSVYFAKENLSSISIDFGLQHIRIGDNYIWIKA